MRWDTSNERQTEINRKAGKRTRFTQLVVQGSGLWSVVKMNLMVWIWEVFFSWQIFFFSLHYSSHCSVQAHGGLCLPSQTGDSLNLKRNPAISHCGISSNVSRSCQAGQCKRKFGQWLVLEPVLVWTSAMPLPRSKVRTWNYVLGNEGSKSTTEEVLVTLSY